MDFAMSPGELPIVKTYIITKCLRDWAVSRELSSMEPIDMAVSIIVNIPHWDKHVDFIMPGISRIHV